jgi:CDP-diacylglycerol--serine O-phosphatidyltransferase
MLRELAPADFLTLANGACGTGSVLAAASHLQGGERSRLWLAFGLLPLAMLFDFLDGRVARWRHRASSLGLQLDSLADLVSFGVAPAVLAFATGMNGGWDAVVLVYFTSCGLGRLARYNVTAASLADEAGKVRYYEGTPIPTSLVLVALLAWLECSGRSGARLPLGSLLLGPFVLHPLVLAYFASGSMMISKTLRIPKP